MNCPVCGRYTRKHRAHCSEHTPDLFAYAERIQRIEKRIAELFMNGKRVGQMLGFHEHHIARGILKHPICAICFPHPDTRNSPRKMVYKHRPAWVNAKYAKGRARKKEMAA